MTVEVLNTGTELLLGEVVNTHAAWFGAQLFPLGLRVSRQTCVPDGEAIRQALEETFPRAEVVLVTGGLGPTTDDITRESAAGLLGLPLREDVCVRKSLEELLARRGIPLRERMLRQTMVPEGAAVLPNTHGTAPGLYIPAREHPRSPHLFLLPGPPRELKPMFEASVLPLLRSLAGGIPARECRVYRLVGIGESAVEEAVGLALSARNDLEVGYCARPNEVDLRIIGSSETLDETEPQILAALGRHLVSKKGENLEAWVVGRLGNLHLKISTAESCTGGLLAHRITNVPGASQVFTHGFVTYSNEAKISELGVPEELLRQNGAVSAPVASAMAEGAMKKSGADMSLSLTGIAGPGGGTEEKPVGLVFVALAACGLPTQCREFHGPQDRETFKQVATQYALDMARRHLLAIAQP